MILKSRKWLSKQEPVFFITEKYGMVQARTKMQHAYVAASEYTPITHRPNSPIEKHIFMVGIKRLTVMIWTNPFSQFYGARMATEHHSSKTIVQMPWH